MGSCLSGSPTEDFTRLRTEDSHDLESTPTRNNRRSSDSHRTGGHQQRRTRPARPLQQTAYHPTPGIQRTASQLSEDDQVKIAQRIGLIQHLPTGLYYNDSSKKTRECAICMLDFEVGDLMRFLPCLHAYHKDCIDDWLMRSFTCPSCMEPVDAALLSSFDG